MGEATIHDGLTGEELTVDQAVERMIANSTSLWPRFRRADPASVTLPTRGTRLYGRSPEGVLSVLVVHFVEEGEVYHALRIRGQRGGLARGWKLVRVPLDFWRDHLREAFAARMPVFTAEDALLAAQFPAPAEPSRP